jgi:hypothetical protein
LLTLPFFFSAVAASSCFAELTVHEWGTFTVLVSSTGQPYQWYQAFADTAPLPPFVWRNGSEIKGAPGNGAMVRMETPVLYFYPSGPMDVTVTATYPTGKITEWFPHRHFAQPAAGAKQPAAFSRFQGPAQVQPANTVWKGSLIQAVGESLKEVPEAGEGFGRHYAAARAVPDAWLFRAAPNAQKDPFAVQYLDEKTKPESVKPVDHFIFYRGEGTSWPNSIYVQTLDDNTFALANYAESDVPVLFAVRVVDGSLAWLPVEKLRSASAPDPAGGNREMRKFSFPPSAKIDAALPQLKRAVIDGLVADGLTKAEAEAMVATWQDLWFTESGTRLLAILPQSVTDGLVQLEVQPKPDKLKRVFVARIEMLSRKTEQELVRLLTSPENDPKAADELQNLKLGRFFNGAVQSAIEIQSAKMRQRASQLLEKKRADEAGKK